MSFEDNPFIQKLIKDGYTFVPLKLEEIIIAAKAVGRAKVEDERFIQQLQANGFEISMDALANQQATRNLDARLQNVWMKMLRDRSKAATAEEALILPEDVQS